MSLALYSTLPCECHQDFNRHGCWRGHKWQILDNKREKTFDLGMYLWWTNRRVQSRKPTSHYIGVEELPFSIRESTWSISVTSRSLEAVTLYSP